MNRNLRYFLLFVFVLFQANVSLAKKDGNEIIEKVRDKYKDLTSLKAEFTQTFVWELAGETQSVKGTLYVKGDKHYRIETEDQLVVTDGATVWTFSKKGEQVIIDLIDNSSGGQLPKDLLFQYAKDYKAKFLAEEKVDGHDTYALALEPKEEDALLHSMKIWVDKDDWFTRKIEQVDINENINTYTIKKIEENPELDASLFKFEIPEAVEVVDLRDAQ